MLLEGRCSLSIVLDAALGKPATDVEVSLIEVRIDGQDDKSIRVLSTGCVQWPGQADELRKTNADGRCTNLIAPEASLSTGVYKMLFNTGQYFAGRGVNSFYPYVEVSPVRGSLLSGRLRFPTLIRPSTTTFHCC